MIDATRHNSIFDPATWGSKRVDVIGAGATGSKIAMSLAKLGVTNLHVWDHDVVEEHNIANQAYTLADIGRPKVEALSDLIQAATGTLITQHGKFTERHARNLGEVVFAMVDSMSGRKAIFDAARYSPFIKLVVDSRMASDYGTLLTYSSIDFESTTRYEATLFSDDDAHVETSACGTSITVGPTGDIINGYAVWAFINHANDTTPLREIAMAGRDPNLLRL